MDNRPRTYFGELIYLNRSPKSTRHLHRCLWAIYEGQELALCVAKHLGIYDIFINGVPNNTQTRNLTDWSIGQWCEFINKRIVKNQAA